MGDTFSCQSQGWAALFVMLGRNQTGGKGQVRGRNSRLWEQKGRTIYCREIKVYGDCKVVRDVVVETGEMTLVETSGADYVQDVTTAWVGKLMCWVKVKHCTTWMSTWMLKSTRRRTEWPLTELKSQKSQ